MSNATQQSEAPPQMITAEVLGGPTVRAPYVSDQRCVVWAVSSELGLPSKSNGAVAFVVRLDTGEEVAVDLRNASASVPLQSELSFSRTETRGTEVVTRNERRFLGWIAPGDRIVVHGTFAGAASPFRGRRTLHAFRIGVEGGPSPAIDVSQIELTEAEP